MASQREIALRRARGERLPAFLLELLNREERAQILSRDRRPRAERRAEALLLEHLTDEEYDQLVRQGYLEIESPSIAGRRYRLTLGYGRPLVIEGGQPVAQLCIGPIDDLPVADVLLTHILLIRGAETYYLRMANRFPIPGMSEL